MLIEFCESVFSCVGSKLGCSGWCIGRTLAEHRFPHRRTTCGDGKQHRASELRHCRSCSEPQDSSRWRHLVAVHGYRAVVCRCLHWQTNHSGYGRWLEPASGAQRSRTSR